MKRKRGGIDRLTIVSIGLAGVAAMLVLGLVQSDTTMRFTRCTVNVKVAKTAIAGAKKPTSRRLVCGEGHDYRVIALKDDQPMPNTPEHVLKNNNRLACSFDVVTNKFGLIGEQIVPESIACSQPDDTG